MLERHVLFCHGSDCKDRGAAKSTDAVREAIDDRRLDDRVLTTRTRCLGLCAYGPIVVVYPEGIWYGDVGAKAGRKIVEQHLQDGVPVDDHVIHRMR